MRTWQNFGEIAQPVEQRPEKPCVPSSILGLATTNWTHASASIFVFWTKMKYLIRNIRFPISKDYDLSYEIRKKTGISIGSENSYEIIRKATDFRSKSNPSYDFTVLLDSSSSLCNIKDVFDYPEPSIPKMPVVKTEDQHPFIIGMGPAGMFCALAMVEKGLTPWLFDRGDKISQRSNIVNEFWNNGILDSNSNVQFGEGGAGAFSDGKLTARSRDVWVEQVYKYMIDFGADQSIAYEALPHLGTEGIRALFIKIREYLQSKGCQFFYRHTLESIVSCQASGVQVVINGNIYKPQNLILALGNASRDTFRMLFSIGFPLQQKAFAVGFRIEHTQEYINHIIYGKKDWASLLGAASYRLTDKKNSVYSFCMCPGGVVTASSSGANQIVTNGMSYVARSGKYGNSAIVTPVDSEEFGSHPLAGIAFQENIETSVFIDSYLAPAQAAKDFVKGLKTPKKLCTSYRPGVYLADMQKIYSARITNAIKKALQNYSTTFSGYHENGVLIAPETRTSSPIRIMRDKDNYCISGFSHIYAIGEGAGYSGGIISSAADGLKIGSIFGPKTS